MRFEPERQNNSDLADLETCSASTVSKCRQDHPDLAAILGSMCELDAKALTVHKHKKGSRSLLTHDQVSAAASATGLAWDAANTAVQACQKASFVAVLDVVLDAGQNSGVIAYPSAAGDVMASFNLEEFETSLIDMQIFKHPRWDVKSMSPQRTQTHSFLADYREFAKAFVAVVTHVFRKFDSLNHAAAQDAAGRDGGLESASHFRLDSVFEVDKERLSLFQTHFMRVIADDVAKSRGAAYGVVKGLVDQVKNGAVGCFTNTSSRDVLNALPSSDGRTIIEAFFAVVTPSGTRCSLPGAAATRVI